MKVAIVGGGLVGTSVARALRLRLSGPRDEVVVVERGVPGAEASWAAGGILSPQAECDVDGPMLRLCLDGLRATRDLCASLGAPAATGLRNTGTLDVAATDDDAHELQQRVSWQREIGLDAVWLSANEVRARCGDGDIDLVGAELKGGAFFGSEASLEPRKLFDALRASAAALGVKSITGLRVASVDSKSVRFEDSDAHVDADAVIVCAGAWTPQVKGAGVDKNAVFPVRGQMVELLTELPTPAPVVYGCGGYLVARGDGRVVVGSTMEQAGYVKALTAGGLLKVLKTATSLMPALAEAPVSSTWAGLRPATRDGLPLLGRSSTGVWIASGHFRNGVLLAAVSGERIAAAVVDGASIDDAFNPSR
jgi:glycine oxidase